MGCGGCELWPNIARIDSALVSLLLTLPDLRRSDVQQQVDSVLGAYVTATDAWHDRGMIIARIYQLFPTIRRARIVETFEKLFRCYAGIMHTRYGARSGQGKAVNPGFAPNFDRPMLRPGEMAKAANWKDLRGKPRRGSPWLDGLPRLIFVSDMGDALSSSIPFNYLKAEIIDTVTSESGRRHLWLWLTKRPARMVEFAKWLAEEHGIEWPENLVAMTSVTGRATRSRIDELRQVPAKFRGLSVEPLVEQVDLELADIDWVIVGGESGRYALEFDIEWARDLHRQCREAGVAYFVKQLGARAVEDKFPLLLVDSHGGNWAEWPHDLRVREFPAGFREFHG